MPAALLTILSTVLPEIAKYGPAAIQAIVSIFSSTTAPTQDQWNALLAATQVTARQQMLATLQAHNIDPASPQGLALLALTPS